MQLRLLLALLGTLLLAEDAKVVKKPGLPLTPERKIEFDTDEGTWLSLSPSPDGRTILFDLLGDLYTVPMEGGEARRIIRGLPFDSQPIYSPDGQLDRLHQRSRWRGESLDRQSRTAPSPSS